jgi:uncharacterized phage-associated protein
MALPTYTADQVARYFLALTDADDNDVSNLKLQKLCYYAQGLCSAMRGSPLFADRIEAWDHGPVVPALYHEYKKHGSQPIPPEGEFNRKELAEADRKALADVYTYYAQFSPWRLRNMTHEEAPWIEASKRADKVITVPALIDYFGPQLEDGYAKKLYG